MPKGKERNNELSRLQKKFGLTLNGLRTIANNHRIGSKTPLIGAHEAQEIGKTVWQALEGYIFRKGGKPRFKAWKHGLNSISGTDNRELIWKPEESALYWRKKPYRVKIEDSQQQVALIFDEKTRQAEKRIGMSMTLFEKAGGGLVAVDGIDGLAVKLGVPAGVLKETVQSFNGKVRADGTAPEAVPPKAHLAAKLDMKGRLYAFYPLTPSITMVYGGLTIDTKARVTAQDGDVICGLYAAGETVNLYYIGLSRRRHFVAVPGFRSHGRRGCGKACRALRPSVLNIGDVTRSSGRKARHSDICLSKTARGKPRRFRS